MLYVLSYSRSHVHTHTHTHTYSLRGYARSFEWTGSHDDQTVRDRWGRRQTDLVAMDALVFHSYAAQLKPGTVKRILPNSSIHCFVVEYMHVY